MIVVSYIILSALIVRCSGEAQDVGYGNEGLFKGSVVCTKRECTFERGVLNTEKSTVYGVYNASFFVSGWDILDIKSGYADKKFSNDDIMYASGYLEGIFTAKKIFLNYQNMHDIWFSKMSQEGQERLKNFFAKQDVWMRNMIAEKSHDPFWRGVGYIIAQYDGLIAGYRSVYAKSKPLDVFAFQVLNGAGDMYDLQRVVDDTSFPDFSKMSRSEVKEYLARRSHCSVLVKVLGAYENVFMSHSTWFHYAGSMRIYKHYDFNIDDPQAVAAKRISFSSYPGYLISVDDFYILGSQMMMMQTTNDILNPELYKAVVPQSLLAWHRVRVANMMANNGEEWAEAFASYNSGTYNCQYVVVDLKKIELKKTIHDGALWVVEQIPTLVKAGDQTAILRDGYWPSYNVPFYEEIYNKSGYPKLVRTKGLDFSYQLAPRAKIFRRDQGRVVDMVTMKRIMRDDDYKHDPYSEDSPFDSICARGDLMKNPFPGGCYDTKVSDYNMALQMKADIINGPTKQGGLKPFEWTSRFNVSHIGLPKIYNFSFISSAPLFSPGKTLLPDNL